MAPNKEKWLINTLLLFNLTGALIDSGVSYEGVFFLSGKRWLIRIPTKLVVHVHVHVVCLNAFSNFILLCIQHTMHFKRIVTRRNNKSTKL